MYLFLNYFDAVKGAQIFLRLNPPNQQPSTKIETKVLQYFASVDFAEESLESFTMDHTFICHTFLIPSLWMRGKSEIIQIACVIPGKFEVIIFKQMIDEIINFLKTQDNIYKIFYYNDRVDSTIEPIYRKTILFIQNQYQKIMNELIKYNNLSSLFSTSESHIVSLEILLFCSIILYFGSLGSLKLLPSPLLLYPTISAMPLRIIEFILYLACAGLIKKRNERILNKILFIAFLLWAIYAFCEFIAIFLILSPELFAFSTFLWAIECIVLVYSAFMFLLCAELISDDSLLKKRRTTLFLFGLLPAIIGFAIFLISPIQVISLQSGKLLNPSSFPPTEPYEYFIDVHLFGVLLYFGPFIVVSRAILLLLRTYKSILSKEWKKRILLTIAGLISGISGICYYIVLYAIDIESTYIIRLIGHIFLIAFPFFIIQVVQ